MSGMKSLPLAKVADLVPALPAKYAAIAAIGVTTGCRITEILSLRRFDLLTRDGKLKDRIAFLKLKNTRRNAKPDRASQPKLTHRKLSIPRAYRPFILRHLRDEERRGYDRPDDLVFRGTLGRALSRLTVYRFFRARLGEGYGTHWMRKTFAQELFRYFVNENRNDPMRALELTRRALGHAQLDTTVKYLGITDAAIEEAQERIFTERRSSKGGSVGAESR